MPDQTLVERTAIRKVTVYLLPFLMLAYFVSSIDRVNLGFAALQMNKEIGLTSAMFGLGGGLFFIGYFLFEVPSNLVLERFGAPRWIARIMISWRVISACTAFVVGPWSFYGLRFLLGIAEAGFFPGVILYLTYWFPRAYRSRVVSLFYVAVPLSSFVGSPISAAILGVEGWLGLHGWQWLFLLEGAPSVLLGLVALRVLPRRPADARWLTPEEKCWLEQTVMSERMDERPVAGVGVWRVMLHPQVLLLSLVYAGSSAASNGLSLWQPQILKAFGLTDMQTGLLNSVPFLLAAIVMILWSRRSDMLHERVWSTALPLGISALALACCLWTSSLTLTVILLSATLIGTYAFKGPFWALSTETLSAGAAAAGLAQVNAIGNLAGFGGTALIGVIRDATHSYPLALLPLVILEATGCVVVVAMGRGRSRHRVLADVT